MFVYIAGHTSKGGAEGGAGVMVQDTYYCSGGEIRRITAHTTETVGLLDTWYMLVSCQLWA